MPVDPTHQSGFYWVTGPEGQGDGTLFYDMRDSKFQASTVDGKNQILKAKRYTVIQTGPAMKMRKRQPSSGSRITALHS